MNVHPQTAPPMVSVYVLPPLPNDPTVQQSIQMWLNEGMFVEDLIRLSLQYNSDLAVGLPLDPILQRKIPLWQNYPTDPVAQRRVQSLASQLVPVLVMHYRPWLVAHRLHFDHNLAVRLVAARRLGGVTAVVANPYLPLDAIRANALMLGANLASDYCAALPRAVPQTLPSSTEQTRLHV